MSADLGRKSQRGKLKPTIIEILWFCINRALDDGKLYLVELLALDADALRYSCFAVFEDLTLLLVNLDPHNVHSLCTYRLNDISERHAMVLIRLFVEVEAVDNSITFFGIPLFFRDHFSV